MRVCWNDSPKRDEAAFTSLMRRHGPLVWSICRRVLAQEQAAEDAFQATFLVLVRKARSVSKRASVRSWLYGVALRVAVRAASGKGYATSANKARDRQMVEASPEAGWDEVCSILDEEIQRLPEKYRLPVILCYLEGQTNDEAARQLNCPPAPSPSGWLERRTLAFPVAPSRSDAVGGIAGSACSRRMPHPRPCRRCCSSRRRKSSSWGRHQIRLPP